MACRKSGSRPGMAMSGHTPGADPGGGAVRRALGGRVLGFWGLAGHSPKKLQSKACMDGPASRPTRVVEEARSLKDRREGPLGANRGRRQGLNLGTWNVTSLGGKEPELVGEAIKYRLDIVGVSSTRKKGSGVLTLTAGWQLFHTGVDPTKFAEAGVAFLVNPALADRVLEWRPISPRIAVLRIKLEDRVLALVQVYAPNTVPEYKPFLDEALVTLNGVARNESIVLMGDFNAHVGKDADVWRGVIGEQGDVSFNEQGRLLLDFCASSGLSVMNTYFQHRPDHRYTWSRPGAAATQRSIIDFFVVAENLRRSVMDVRVKRGAELSTDHYLVVCKLRLARWCLPQRKVQRHSATRICWEALAED